MNQMLPKPITKNENELVVDNTNPVKIENESLDNRLNFVPPNNLDAEQAIIGLLLNNNELLYEQNIISIISYADFYSIQHQIIYKSILDLISREQTADLITLIEKLTKSEELEKIGGKNYLVDILANTPVALNLKEYAEIVRTKSVMRQLYDVGQKISQLAYNPGDKTPENVLDTAEQLVFRIAEQGRRNKKTGLQPITGVLDEINEKVHQMHKQGTNNGITGIETGFYDLDQQTSGLQRGDLIIIAGRPSMGKTAFAMNIASYVSVNLQKTVAIFSMEMPASQLVMRMISNVSEIKFSKLRTAQFQHEDWYKFGESIERLKASSMFIDESGALSALEIRAKVRRLKREKPELSLVVIDYIQLMSSSRKMDSRVYELSEISRSLKALAKEINIPIIVLSQLSRAVDSRADKRPVMSDLRDSGAIEQDADLVILMYREAYYYDKDKSEPPSKVNPMSEIIIGKHRNGPVGTVRLMYQGEFIRFVNPNKVDYGDSYY